MSKPNNRDREVAKAVIVARDFNGLEESAERIADYREELQFQPLAKPWSTLDVSALASLMTGRLDDDIGTLGMYLSGFVKPPAKPAPRGDALRRDLDNYNDLTTVREYIESHLRKSILDKHGRNLALESWERISQLLASSQGQGEAFGGDLAVQIPRGPEESADDAANRWLKAHPHPAPGLREAEAAYNHAEVFHTRLVAAQEALEAYPAVVTEIINGYGIIVNEDQVRPYLAEKLAQHIARATLAQSEREPL